VPRRSLEQRNAKLGFKTLNPPRERRLRQIELISRFAETSDLVDSEKCAQIKQVEIDAHYALKLEIFAFVNRSSLVDGWCTMMPRNLLAAIERSERQPDGPPVAVPFPTSGRRMLRYRRSGQAADLGLSEFST